MVLDKQLDQFTSNIVAFDDSLADEQEEASIRI